MPIKWSALEVAEAMDEVERLLNQAEPFLADAEIRVGQAKCTPNLPKYMHQNLGRLIYTVKARAAIRRAIESVRNDIPQDAIEAERQTGKQQGFDL